MYRACRKNGHFYQKQREEWSRMNLEKLVGAISGKEVETNGGKIFEVMFN